jgi:hypothetical protein
MTNYIYLTYGSSDYRYLEMAYAIGTLFKKIDAASSRVIVFTDQPERVTGWPVICESIANELADMQGPKRFNHRAKLCVILRCLERYPGNVLLMDSDTFVKGDIQGLTRLIAPGKTILDSLERWKPMPEL